MGSFTARRKSWYTDAAMQRTLVTLWILALGLLLTSCASDLDAGKRRVMVIDVGQGDSFLIDITALSTVVQVLKW